MRRSARYLPDDIAAVLPSAYYNAWQPDASYVLNDKVKHNGQLYNVEQPELVSSSVYPPGAEGTTALYRPINLVNTGTQDDPIPWIYGMDCADGLYYLHNGTIYKALQSMAPCTWEPGAAGTETIWEAVQ